MALPNNEKPITNPEGRPDLRSRRQALGLTLKQVAAAAAVHYSHVMRIEKGEARTTHGPRPRRWAGPAVARVEAALAHAEANTSLPTPLDAARDRGETRAEYAANPKACERCGRPILMAPSARAADTRRRRFCGLRCVALSQSRRPRATAKPITHPTGRPDLRARRFALGLTMLAAGRLVGCSPEGVSRIERGHGRDKGKPLHWQWSDVPDRLSVAYAGLEAKG